MCACVSVGVCMWSCVCGRVCVGVFVYKGVWVRVYIYTHIHIHIYAQSSIEPQQVLLLRHRQTRYGVATIRRLLKITGLFCKISSLL